jgi:hypothetical protein
VRFGVALEGEPLELEVEFGFLPKIDGFWRLGAEDVERRVRPQIAGRDRRQTLTVMRAALRAVVRAGGGSQSGHPRYEQRAGFSSL